MIDGEVRLNNRNANHFESTDEDMINMKGDKSVQTIDDVKKRLVSIKEVE